MQAVEFEADITGNTLTIPPDVNVTLAQGKHVKIIMLMDENPEDAPQEKTFRRAKVDKICLPSRESLHER